MRLENDAAVKAYLEGIELPENTPAVLVVICPQGGARFIENCHEDRKACRVLAGAFLSWLGNAIFRQEGFVGLLDFANLCREVLLLTGDLPATGKELHVFQAGEVEAIAECEGPGAGS